MTCRLDPCPVHVVADHGTRARYISRYHACRCEECREANRVYCAAYRSDRLRRSRRRAPAPLFQTPDGWKRRAS